MIMIPEVADDLSWMSGLLDAAQIPTGPAGELRIALRQAAIRAADPELKIAVFGETSSGKSTLLNAFLRRRILPSSALTTTRATLTIRRGDTTEVRASTLAGEDFSWPSTTVGPWLAGRFGECPRDIEQALRVLLTTGSADELASLELRFPRYLLDDQVALIDTPGFSVPDAHHRERAVQAAQQADLALIVVPAVAAVSLTMGDFLTGPLSDHHDRCAFILTKMDLIDADEQIDVVQAVRRRLELLEIEVPVVLECAPELALRELASSQARDTPHLAEFEEVEAQIAALAADRRRGAMEATTLGLLGKLLTEVEQSAVDQGQRLAKANEEVSRLSLPDFANFLATWQKTGSQRLRTAIDRAFATYSSDWSQANLLSKIADAVSGDQIRDLNAAASRVSDIVRDHLESDTESLVDDLTSGAADCLDEYAADLARDFQGQFSVLAGLAQAESPIKVRSLPSTVMSGPDLSAVNDTLTALGATLTSTGNLRTGGGAVAGAIIGSIVFPGLGTVIGGFLGGLIGHRRPDAARAAFMTQARQVIDSARADLDEGIESARMSILAEARTQVEGLCRAYERECGTEIVRLTKAEARTRADLAAKIAAMQEIATEARRRRERVGRLRATTRPVAATGSPSSGRR
jgi:hypothetical protein